MKDEQILTIIHKQTSPKKRKPQ